MVNSKAFISKPLIHLFPRMVGTLVTLVDCPMPKLGAGGVGFLRSGDMGDTQPLPSPQKGRSYVPSRRRAPAHGISPLLFTTQSGRVSRSLLTNVFASSPLSHRVYNNCKLCVGITVARFGDNVNLDLEWRHLQLNLSLVLIGEPQITWTAAICWQIPLLINQHDHPIICCDPQPRCFDQVSCGYLNDFQLDRDFKTPPKSS